MTTLPSAQHPRLLILIPVYNDWPSLQLLLDRLADVLIKRDTAVSLLLIDDASEQPPPAALSAQSCQFFAAVSILRLRRNLGHQRALAVGITYAAENLSFDQVVIMDADGEDDPRHIPRLLEKLNDSSGALVVFARRARRSESLVFRAGYIFYRFLHRLLTGVPVRVGNFSVLRQPALDRLVVMSELWNHYAAAVFRSGLPHTSVPTRRAQRLAGRSRMNLVSLAVHGLSALSVYSDVVGVRLLLASASVLAFLTLFLLGYAVVSFIGVEALPGWTGPMALGIVLLVSQVGILSLAFAMLTLQGRGSPGVVPARDCPVFVERITDVLANEKDRASRRPTSRGAEES